MNIYPSEEELNAFLSDIEQQELYAPKHLKEQILEQVSNQKAQKKVQQSVQMFTYSLKMAAGMAAALIMLVLLPMSGSKEADRDLIAVKEQKQIEALQEWEEKQEREVQTREKRNKILEEGKNAAEKKVADILDFLNEIWKKEAEEM